MEKIVYNKWEVRHKKKESVVMRKKGYLCAAALVMMLSSVQPVKY